GQDVLAYQLLAARAPEREGELRSQAARRWLALEPSNLTALMWLKDAGRPLQPPSGWRLPVPKH
ncbi:hypothetical protein, partial [Pseudomonas promysalinigenes]|uniref:hypothetical protein n=1 Tax=Pseudomonas promysalinigenes TaxID=485898 RepID=UPI003FA06758